MGTPPQCVVLCSSRHVTRLYDWNTGQPAFTYAFSSDEVTASQLLVGGKGTCVAHGPHLSLQEAKAQVPGATSWTLPKQYGDQITSIRRLSKLLLAVTAKGQGTVILLEAKKLAQGTGTADVGGPCSTARSSTCMHALPAWPFWRLFCSHAHRKTAHPFSASVDLDRAPV